MLVTTSVSIMLRRISQLTRVLNAFKDGFDNNGFLDSKNSLYNLTMLMTKLQNLRKYWFQQRQALESMSRDLSDACL
jgi:hypothetical protein